MKFLMDKYVNKYGYISVEIVIIVAIILIGGLIGINKYASKGKKTTSKTNETVSKVYKDYGGVDLSSNNSSSNNSNNSTNDSLTNTPNENLIKVSNDYNDWLRHNYTSSVKNPDIAIDNGSYIIHLHTYGETSELYILQIITDKLKPNTTYTMSGDFRMKTDSEKAEALYYVESKEWGEKKQWHRYSNLNSIPHDNQWHRVKDTFTTDDLNTPYVAITFALRYGNADLWAKNLKLEEGPNATKFTDR